MEVDWKERYNLPDINSIKVFKRGMEFRLNPDSDKSNWDAEERYDETFTLHTILGATNESIDFILRNSYNIDFILRKSYNSEWWVSQDFLLEHFLLTGLGDKIDLLFY